MFGKQCLKRLDKHSYQTMSLKCLFFNKKFGAFFSNRGQQQAFSKLLVLTLNNNLEAL